MSKVQSLVGQRFSRLTVLDDFKIQNNKTYWLCKCNCGNEKYVRADSLKDGSIQSCGCLMREVQKSCENKHKTHGLTKTKLHNVWGSMKRRCYNKNVSRYENYGGKGIKVCDEWQEFLPFYEWAIANGYQEGLTIERIDVNGNYEPSNCTWITMEEQAKNKTNTTFLTYKGVTKRLVEWAKEYNIDRNNLRTRIFKCGWDIEKALTTPLIRSKKNG